MVESAVPMPGFLFPRARAQADQAGLGTSTQSSRERPRVTITVLSPQTPARDDPRVVEAAKESAQTWLQLPGANQGIRHYLAIQTVLAPRAPLVDAYA